MMTVSEALAVARLRQWAVSRCSNQNGKIRRPNAQGWKRRDERSFDAALVRVIDFERALSALAEDEQIALVLRYRDKQEATQIAVGLQCSVRRVSYLIPMARRHLADILDRLNLL
jgi:DNA-directed RNA polymerase specialized sigma24 family protein